jgi:tetratricopeptide (TPR) repeat protein
MFARRQPGLVFGIFAALLPMGLEGQAPTPDQRDLGVCPALRPALDGAGPNAGIADIGVARAALSRCAPGTIPTILGTAMVLMAENNVAAARTEANRAVALAPTDPYVLRMMCHAEFIARDYGRAVDLCSQALARRPDWDQALHYRGVAHVRAGRAAQGIADLERAVARNPRLTLTWTELSLTHRSSGARDKAADAMRRALELTPNDAPRLFTMSEILSELRRHAEAEAMADRLLARRTTAPDYNRRGNTRFAQRKYQLALADYQAAEAADPKAAYAVFNQGVTAQALRGCSNATPLFERAARMDTTYAAPLWSLMECQADDDAKLRTLTLLMRRDSMNAKTWGLRAEMRPDSTRAQRDSSIREFDRAIKLDTTNFGDSRYRGRLHALNGDYARAVPDFRRVAERTGWAKDVAQFTEALEKSGQAAEAIAVLTKFDDRERAEARPTRVYLGMRGLVRLRTGDIEGARDVAEWVYRDDRTLDEERQADASHAYRSARSGGIARIRFETALTVLESSSTHRGAARFLRLGMLVDEGDRRAAHEAFQSIPTVVPGIRRSGGAVIGRFLLQDIGAQRTQVAYWDSENDACRRDSSLVCRAVLNVHPNGDVYAVMDSRSTLFAITDYDPVNRRAKLGSERGEVELDLRDANRPLMGWVSGEKSALRRCANEEACR